MGRWLLFLALTVLGVLLLVGLLRSGPDPVSRWNGPEIAERGLPFSQAVRAGDLIFIAGTLGTEPGGLDLARGGIQAETRAMMDNIGRALAAFDADFDDLLSCTVFMADMDEWPAMNAVYQSYFEAGAYPARAAVGVEALALGARVEIQCIAQAAG